MHPVRAAFAAAGYTEPALEKLLTIGKLRAAQIDRRKYPALIRRTSGGTPIEILVQTFLLGGTVERATLANAVGSLEPVVEAGLIPAVGDPVRANYRVLPLDPLLIALDAPWQLPQDRTLQVMPPSSSSFSLAQITIRRSVESVLDLGTGCGMQALMAASHARTVVATDRNPRAVALTALNAELNGLTIESREGDWFEPVIGRTFDLIVGNLPYVVSPGEKHMYRDSGRPGDAMSRDVVRAAPAHLNPGGFAQFLINWVQKRGDDWRKRFRDDWLAGGCDAWVFTSQKHDPVTYTLTWLPEEPTDPDFDRRFNDWLAYFDSENVEAIFSGSITLRKRDGANWFRHDDSPALTGDCGESIARGFELFDALVGRTDEQLLATRFRPSPDLRGVQTLAPGEGGWKPVAATLKLDKGLSFAGTVDLNLLALVTRIGPENPLGAVLHEVAKTWRKDPAEVVRAALPLLRELMLQGMLLPAPEPGA